MRVVTNLESEGLVSVPNRLVPQSLQIAQFLLGNDETQHLVETVQIKGSREIPQTIPAWIPPLFKLSEELSDLSPEERGQLLIEIIQATQRKNEIKK